MPSPLRETRKRLGPLLRDIGFLRLDRSGDALFVSDAPRRLAEAPLYGLIESIGALGMRTRVNARGLLLVELDLPGYEALLAALPEAEAPLPEDDSRLPVYALVRLARLHPAPLFAQPLAPLRASLTRYEEETAMTALARSLLSDCAALLRRREPLPTAAGRVMNAWLLENARPTPTKRNDTRT